MSQYLITKREKCDFNSSGIHYGDYGSDGLIPVDVPNNVSLTSLVCPKCGGMGYVDVQVDLAEAIGQMLDKYVLIPLPGDKVPTTFKEKENPNI